MSPSDKQQRIIGHSIIISDLIKENDFKIFAEIGVWKGGTTKRILRKTALREYWGIDPWLTMPYGSKVQRKREQWQWDGYHMYCCGLMIYFPQLRILRTTSEQAVSMFPDGYFDMIYIDARHDCHSVDEDVGLWFPKVKVGGILGGHDYGGKWPGVKKAVDMWFDEEDLTVWERDEVWMVKVE
jgi:hypothetical protein